MSNVINLNEENFKHVSYTDLDGDIGIATKCRSLGIIRLNKSEFEVQHNEGSFVLDREVLSEFLHVSAMFLDPDGKYKPNLEMIACDY
jgi:hypothetical protein